MLRPFRAWKSALPWLPGLLPGLVCQAPSRRPKISQSQNVLPRCKSSMPARDRSRESTDARMSHPLKASLSPRPIPPIIVV